MRVFLLGAGKPAHGHRPSALKDIGLGTRALDWQIQSFEGVASIEDVHFLGGYQCDAIIAQYPKLNFTIIPDWEQNGVLHTFLKAPFAKGAAFTAYSDTIFRAETISEMAKLGADVVFGVDSLWKERYEARPEQDIRLAETVSVNDDEAGCTEVEFTGLLFLSSAAVRQVSSLPEAAVGSNLLQLLAHLKDSGLSLKPFDVLGQWAEFNLPGDVAKFVLGTKAQTLERLRPLVHHSQVGKQVSFTLSSWRRDPELTLDEIATTFGSARLVVRSSSAAEDNWHSSNAGRFESLLDVDSTDRDKLVESINCVFASYGPHRSSADQVLVQEFVHNVRAAGVVFTRELDTGAPYYRFNIDDQSRATDTVTAGVQADLRTIIVSRVDTSNLGLVEPMLTPVLDAVQEQERLLGFDKLDLEFAIDENASVHTFQVRPITVDHSQFEIDPDCLEASLRDAVRRFRTLQEPSAFVLGERAIFGNMPDWNPAEIIGTRPKTLAFSLYRKLITDEVWAQQRAEFGYRDLRPHPLIVSFCGQPFVDVRASLNSFIPSSLASDTATRLVDAYINVLSDHPQFHDKIEFDVAFTIWTPDFREEATKRLLPYGVTDADIEELEFALMEITREALVRLQNDIAPIDTMNHRRKVILSSNLPNVDKFVALIMDCSRFGTLAFAHAARAGFAATVVLKSLVTTGTLSDERRMAFLQSFSTVAGEFEKDKRANAEGRLSSKQLVERYGHLRPGTYELSVPAYWEDPDFYLGNDVHPNHEFNPEFEFSSSETKGIERMLRDLGSNLTEYDLISYLREAIQAREFIKFEFTKNLSSALSCCVELGKELGIDRTDMSFLDYRDLEDFKLNIVSANELKSRIETRKQAYSVTQLVQFPAIIKNEVDFYCFERLSTLPNFVTTERIEAEVECLDGQRHQKLHDKVVLIPQADPGYDWLFGLGIAGLIIKHGGANSHMAIRAAEIGLPSAIGIGDSLYEKVAGMKRIELDCGNQIIRNIE